LNANKKRTMQITATIHNSFEKNDVTVSTDEVSKELKVPSKKDGFASAVNGAELLFLALATCFSNDIYREAAKRKMQVTSVDVTVTGRFGKEGETGSDISYTAKVSAPAHSQAEINELIAYVDSIAEIHNTLRRGAPVTLK
jgi:organic hydroperoxide reductase OsmC/OhrA